MADKLITISEAAKIIGVSMDTLRRWDKKGVFRSKRHGTGGYRYYDRQEAELFINDVAALAKDWAYGDVPFLPRPADFYSRTASDFQARLAKMESELSKVPRMKDESSLIVSIVGEMGNNSFDHNLGSWPDIMGVFFGYDMNKGIIALADRGQGILKTLKRVRPELESDEQSLKVAFTEIISGRAPESRGNGLKYVRKVMAEYIKEDSVSLLFQSGEAALTLRGGEKGLNIEKSDIRCRGCLAIINF